MSDVEIIPPGAGEESSRPAEPGPGGRSALEGRGDSPGARENKAAHQDRVKFARLIAEAWQASVEAILDTGQQLIEAKAGLPHGEFEDMCAKDLPFGTSTARRLMIIARHEWLSNRAHVHVLPASWGTLYELSKLDDETLEARFADGTFTTETERAEIVASVKKAKAGGTGGDPARGESRRENDFYPTPDSIVAEIVRRWKPKARHVWEPCAGDGRIAEALADAGFEVFSSDIAWATGGDSGEAGEARDGGTKKGQDFFAAASPPGSAVADGDPARSGSARRAGVADMALCTNPPFDRVREFIDHAFAIGIEEICLVLPERIWACAAGREQFERHRPALWVNLDWREDYLGKGGSPDRALAVAIWTSPCASECRFEVWGRNGSPERSGSARSEGAEDSTEGDDEQNPNGSTGGIVGTTPFDAGSGPGADVDARPGTATSENVEAGDEDSYTTPPSSEGGQIPGADGSLTPRDHSQAKPDDEAEAGPPPKQASGAGQERPDKPPERSRGVGPAAGPGAAGREGGDVSLPAFLRRHTELGGEESLPGPRSVVPPTARPAGLPSRSSSGNEQPAASRSEAEPAVTPASPARGKEERPARGSEERPARGETINALIRAGYARDTPLPALAAQTGLTENAVKQRAKRMGLGDRQRAWKLGAGKGKAER